MNTSAVTLPGLWALSVVSKLSIDCRDEPIYIINVDHLTLEDGVTSLILEEKHRQSRLVWRDASALTPSPIERTIRLSDLPPAQ